MGARDFLPLSGRADASWAGEVAETQRIMITAVHFNANKTRTATYKQVTRSRSSGKS